MIEFNEIRLGEIFNIEDGDRGVNYPKQDEFFEEGYCLFLNAGNVTQRGFSFSDKQFISIEKDQKLRKGKLHREDIVLTTRGTVGNVAYYDNNIKYDNVRINSGMVILRNYKESSNTRYLYQYIKSPVVQSLIKLYSSGSAQPQLPIKDLKRIKFSLPYIDIQNRIANILFTYDDLIENNNRRIALLEKTAQELYKEWFVRFRFPGYETAEFENGYPAKWKVEKVKSIVKRLPFGRLYKEADVSKEGNVIVIDQSKEACIGFHNDDPSHIATIDRPIILFGDHSCKFELMITPFSLSENVVPFVGTENVDSAYLYFLVKDLIETTEYKRHWTELMSKKVLLADNDIQKEFTKVIKSNLLLIESLKVQNRNLTKQRDLLLPRLMSGKLEVG